MPLLQANVRGRDLGGFVADFQRRIEQGLLLPAGYSIGYGGQFESQQQAMRRLMIVLPLSVLVIFGLLFATFDSAQQAFLILLNVPFAMVGGVAALNGIVMVSYINTLRARGMNCEQAVLEGAATRLRPVLMTAMVASLGFVPMALATTIGAEVQRPLATVVIGGLITATILTLFLLPALYPWFSGREPCRRGEAAVAD